MALYTHRCHFKRRRGTFSLHNQVVWDTNSYNALDGMTVFAIHYDPHGIKRGRITLRGRSVNVEQLGKTAWATLSNLQKEKNIAELSSQ